MYLNLVSKKHSIIHGMHSKYILIASLTHFWSLVIFYRDDFILGQCAVVRMEKSIDNFENTQMYQTVLESNLAWIITIALSILVSTGSLKLIKQ